MPKFRIEELEDDNFDFNRLKLNEDELREFANKFLENRKKVWAKYGKLSKDDIVHVPFSEELKYFKFLDEEIVSITLYEDNIFSMIDEEEIFAKLTGRNLPRLWLFEKLYTVFSRYKFLASKFLLISSCFKDYSVLLNIFSSGYVSIDERINFLLNADLDKVERLLNNDSDSFDNSDALELITSEQSLRLLRVKNVKLRHKIYKKVGILNHLESMLKEDWSLTRSFAASTLNVGGPRFSILLDEDKGSVLQIALKKCPEYMLPMFLAGNEKVKEMRYLQEIIKERLSAATS